MDMSDTKATVSFTPCHDGNGYSWGGDAILTIGAVSVNFGKSGEIAREIAERWNAAPSAPMSATEAARALSTLRGDKEWTRRYFAGDKQVIAQYDRLVAIAAESA
jgi:hypothetical protein